MLWYLGFTAYSLCFPTLIGKVYSFGIASKFEGRLPPYIDLKIRQISVLVKKKTLEKTLNLVSSFSQRGFKQQQQLFLRWYIS